MTDHDNFLSNPKILKNYSMLQELEVLSHIESLQREIRNYESILGSASIILHKTNLDEIIETTVQQISEKFLPSFIVFLWHPLQNKKDIVIKGYKNFKAVDVFLEINDLSPFESFFLKYPSPISYELLEFQMAQPEVTDAFNNQKPEIVGPIVGPSGLYGLILIGSKLLESQYSPNELSFLDKLMNFASLAIQNHIHYEHSVRDTKTGLFNHGYFMIRLNDEIARAKRKGIPFSLIVLDVDKFKNFNDTYGHLAGDSVLEQLALSIQESVRTQDVPSRFGGEEFTILLPETDKQAAWIVSERLRENIQEMQVPWEVPLPQVTVSSGIATYLINQDTCANDVIERADEALYLSKNRGRNRSTIWGAGLLYKTQQFIEASDTVQIPEL